MSNLEIIKLWKEKAEIDYIPPFMSLWVSLNAWMKYRFKYSKDRDGLEALKDSAPLLLDKFKELIGTQSINGVLFRGYFGGLHRALSSVHIPYNIRPNEIVSFECCVIDWNHGDPQFESILIESEASNLSSETSTEFDETRQETIELDDDLTVENNPERLFAAYIEIVYQVRCALFHGDLAPTPEENKKVIQQLYLTLSMVMEDI